MDLSDISIFTEPQQGASYGDLLAVAQRAESLGYRAFYRSDHFLKMGDTDGLPGPTDAWVTLAGLARDTSTIRLGTLVTSATFRLPGPLAISVAQVDEMSGGRVELGLGAGWYEQEHTAYGIPFPPLSERFERLEEQLEIIMGLWSTPLGETYSKPGGHFPVTDSPGLPKPVQDPLPIVVGGGGPVRTPRLAARFASEYNTPFLSLDGFRTQRGRVIDACEKAGRDPSTMTFSGALVLCVGATEEEFGRRAEAIGREPAELRENGVAGLPDEAAATIRAWREAGADRLFFQVLDLGDLDHLDLAAGLVGG